MNHREPVLLTVLVETVKRRWFIAGMTLDGHPVPLMCSETGNLDPYIGVVPEEQVDFLRHRLSGVLQRGCDRLSARHMKPRLIIFVVDADFEQGSPELTQQVAEHFVLWMSSPPVVFFRGNNGFCRAAIPAFSQIAGNLDPTDEQILAAGLPQLVDSLENSDLWELSPNKPPS